MLILDTSTVVEMSSSLGAPAVSVVTESLLESVREDCRRTKAELDRALRDADDFVNALVISEDEVHERLFTKYVGHRKCGSSERSYQCVLMCVCMRETLGAGT